MIEVTAFITALSHATNVAKAAIQARDESKRHEALAELTSAFADLQVKHLAIIQNQQTLIEQNETLKNSSQHTINGNRKRLAMCCDNFRVGDLFTRSTQHRKRMTLRIGFAPTAIPMVTSLYSKLRGLKPENVVICGCVRNARQRLSIMESGQRP